MHIEEGRGKKEEGRRHPPLPLKGGEEEGRRKKWTGSQTPTSL
ncbi:hypothetical protein [Okeania sp. SIO2C9]|nr:hypothetical protein [Okeania sp. SIO2C9]